MVITDKLVKAERRDAPWKKAAERYRQAKAELEAANVAKVEVEGLPWRDAAEQYRQAKEALEAAKAAEAEAKATLEALAGEESARGCGVSLSRYFVKGPVDYRKAAYDDVDREKYRKPGRYQTRITIEGPSNGYHG